jgi:hypothetical protein
VGGIRVVGIAGRLKGGFERMEGDLEEIVEMEGCVGRVGRVGGVLEDG